MKEKASSHKKFLYPPFGEKRHIGIYQFKKNTFSVKY